MTRDEARRQLAERLMMIAEALLSDEEAGLYEGNEETGELKIESTLGNSTTIVAITNWDEYAEEEWPAIIS